MALVNKLPAGIFSAWSNINVFFAQNVMPATSWSGGVVSSITGLFSTDQPSTNDEGEAEAKERYGVDRATAKEIDGLFIKYLVAEGMKGGNDEALLCSKARNTVSWHACEDYMTCMRTLSEMQKERLAKDPSAEKMRVRLHFAESDIMIGKGGQKYFEECWEQDGFKEAVDVKSTEWPGSNHDSILSDAKGVLRSIFEDMKDV